MKRQIRFVMMIAVMVMISVFFISETVESRGRGQLRIEADYYGEMEKNYVSEIKKQLKKYGIENSGINLTYVSDDGETRIYKVKIHNRQLGWMAEKQREMLREEIAEIEFPANNCRFFHEFVADKEL